jgi:Ran GTPase-activating protein (RanGAP) involved in mRNA processing and transport
MHLRARTVLFSLLIALIGSDAHQTSEPLDVHPQPSLKALKRTQRKKSNTKTLIATGSALAVTTAATALVASLLGKMAYRNTQSSLLAAACLDTSLDTSGEKISWQRTYLEPEQWQDIFNSIQTNPRITQLHFSDVDLRKSMPSLLSCLRTNGSLKQLELALTCLNNAGAHQLFDTLKTNNSLTSLTISYGLFSDQATPSIIQCLQSNKTLTKLALTHGCLSAEQLNCLVQSLPEKGSLRTLILNKGYGLQDTAITALQATAIGQALQHNKTLTNLGLGGLFYEGKNILPVIRALRSNTALKKLDLSSNHFDNAALSELVLSLKANSTLSNLCLDNMFIASNYINEPGMSDLLEGLKTQQTLKVLSLKKILPFHTRTNVASYLAANSALEELSLCPDDTSGAFEALEHNTTLRSFDLNGATISVLALQKLVAALSKNSTLIQLDLSNSRLEGDKLALIVLERALKTNLSLQYCNLASRYTDSRSYSTINSYLHRNRERILATAFFAFLHDKTRIVDTKQTYGPPNALAQDLIKLGRSREITEHIMRFLVGNRSFTQATELDKKIYKPRLLYPTTRLLKELDADKPTAKKQAFWLVRSCKIWNEAEMNTVMPVNNGSLTN